MFRSNWRRTFASAWLGSADGSWRCVPEQCTGNA